MAAAAAAFVKNSKWPDSVVPPPPPKREECRKAASNAAPSSTNKPASCASPPPSSSSSVAISATHIIKWPKTSLPRARRPTLRSNSSVAASVLSSLFSPRKSTLIAKYLASFLLGFSASQIQLFSPISLSHSRISSRIISDVNRGRPPSGTDRPTDRQTRCCLCCRRRRLLPQWSRNITLVAHAIILIGNNPGGGLAHYFAWRRRWCSFASSLILSTFPSFIFISGTMKGNNVISSDLNLKLRSTVCAQFPDCVNSGAAEEDNPYSILCQSDLLCYCTLRA